MLFWLDSVWKSPRELSVGVAVLVVDARSFQCHHDIRCIIMIYCFRAFFGNVSSTHRSDPNRISWYNVQIDKSIVCAKAALAHWWGLIVCRYIIICKIWYEKRPWEPSIVGSDQQKHFSGTAWCYVKLCKCVQVFRCLAAFRWCFRVLGRKTASGENNARTWSENIQVLVFGMIRFKWKEENQRSLVDTFFASLISSVEWSCMQYLLLLLFLWWLTLSCYDQKLELVEKVFGLVVVSSLFVVNS